MIGQKGTHILYTHTAQDILLAVKLLCVMTVILPHRWLSRLSMAVAGYSEQEKIRQDQGEISHRLFAVLQRILSLLQVAGLHLYKTP